MIGDPYKILEISPNATDDEVKKAYREMSRKYHPDSYVNNPLADLAEEKFKEVQDAYQQIMKDRQNGGGGSSSYANSTYSSNSAYSGNDAAQLNQVASLLNARKYQDAINALNQISNHSAVWYYYSAAAQSGIGNNMMAMEYARQAVNMDPGNKDYKNLLNQLEWQGQRYQNTRTNMGSDFGTGNLCCDLWCADTLCECMGGDLCACF